MTEITVRHGPRRAQAFAHEDVERAEQVLEHGRCGRCA